MIARRYLLPSQPQTYIIIESSGGSLQGYTACHYRKLENIRWPPSSGSAELKNVILPIPDQRYGILGGGEIPLKGGMIPRRLWEQGGGG